MDKLVAGGCVSTIPGCEQRERRARRPLSAWPFPVHRLLHNDPSRSHSDGMEGGFFCLHKLKQNICEKNNPSPSPLLVKNLRCPCNSKSQCKLLLRKSIWGLYCIPAGGVLSWESRRPGAWPAESGGVSSGKTPPPYAEGLGKARRNSPPGSAAPGWRPAQGCEPCLLFFELTTSFISFGLHKLPPHSARSPGLSLRIPREQKLSSGALARTDGRQRRGTKPAGFKQFTSRSRLGCARLFCLPGQDCLNGGFFPFSLFFFPLNSGFREVAAI